MNPNRRAVRNLSATTLATPAVLGSASAVAQSDSYYHGGVSLGQSRGQVDEGRINAGVIPLGLAVTGQQTQERDIAWKAFGGYQFNRYLGVEAGSFSLGSFDFMTSTTPAGKLQRQIKVQGLSLDLVGYLPITDKLSALGRVGGQYARTRGEYTGSGAVGNFHNTPSDRRGDIKAGLGLQYAFSPAVLLRGEVERYRISDAMGGRDHANACTLSLVFPFGRAPQALRIAYAAPAYVAPAPAPAPQAAALPAPVPMVMAAPVAPVVMSPPQPRRISFSADSLFGFNESRVRPEAKAGLDTFARELQGAQYDLITVEGHTDRIGSNTYNQKLSEQRAEAVKAYLVGRDGLSAAKITAVGKRETKPVTKPEDCKGNQATPKLIACLQPDRRVDFEMTGTR